MAGVVGIAGSAAGSLQSFPAAHLQEVVRRGVRGEVQGESCN